jgi:hypothetical protein
MNKSFSVLKSNVGTYVQDSSTAFSSNIGIWINNKYQDILSRHDWEELYYIMSLTASANVSAYGLNDDVDKMIFIIDSTNGNYLTENSETQFHQEHYDVLDDVGTPQRYFIKYDVVKSQPASAAKLTLKSSSASDVTQSILIRSIIDGGEYYETVSLSGTSVRTATQSSSRVLGISKTAVTAGNITVYDNDGVTVLAFMPPEKLESRYRQLHLHPIPSGETVYHLRVKRKVLPLNQNYDYPIVSGIDNIIETGAAADAWRSKRQFSKAREYDYLYEKMLQEKIFQRVAQPNQVILTNPSALNRDDGIL